RNPFCSSPKTTAPPSAFSAKATAIVPARSAPARSARPPVARASRGAKSSAGMTASARRPIRPAAGRSGPSSALTASAGAYGTSTRARVRARRRARSARSGVRRPALKKSTRSATELTVARSGAELLPQRRHELRHFHPDLGHVVALADRHRLVGERFEVHRHAQRSADLILPPIPPADGLGLVVRRLEVRSHAGPDRSRQLAQLGLLRQRQHRDLVRRECVVEPQHDTRALLVGLLVVRGAEERERRAIRA